MWLPGWIRSVQPPHGERPGPASLRNRLAAQLALVTVVCLCLVFILSKGTQFLMPGPLASVHGGIENCSACHTKSGSGKLSWVHGLVAGDPLADGKACITCHKMPDTAFNPHGASADALKQSTERLTKIAAATPAPQSARAQSYAFPTHDVVARGVFCASCHQEHQGVNFKLNKISNEQCRSCHVVQFDSFDGDHPKFDNYPFNRRTRIIYDHAGHFNKHYPEVAKKEPAKRIPETCSSCHDSRGDKRIMAVAPFEKTCAVCHLDQITGKERVSGPKGVAFLTVPGLDLQTLKKKNATIGEWPDASEAELTPFMKVMIGRNERGRALIKTVDSLNLQDLTNASDGQIKAVTDLVWEIKQLFYALISGKASDVLGDLNIGGGAKLSATLVADLTASISRDVVISAQQQWLPNLAAEIANPQAASEQKQSGPSAATTESSSPVSAPPEEQPNSDAGEEAAKPNPQDASSEAASKLDPPACVLRVFGQCLVSKGQEDAAQAPQTEGAAKTSEPQNAKPDGGKEIHSFDEMPGAMRLGVKDAGTAGKPEAARGKTDTANAKPDAGKQTLAAGEQPKEQATDKSDELLFPTEEELREIKAHDKGAQKAGQPEEAAGGAKTADPATAAEPQTRSAPVISIQSNVDPESWAEYGGWYRQDYAIFYRPTGHKDKFIYSWLFLTGPQAPKGGKSPAAAVFDFLTSKDAQGSCTKCHSVDDIQGKGRVVNFSPPSVATKQGSFTSFIHEPHFGLLDERGCLTCHKLEKDQAQKTDTGNAKPDAAVSAGAASVTPANKDAEKSVSAYLKSYEHGDPQKFASDFSAVKKDLCQTCHTSSKARQDCLTCHKYHVNGVITPITSTKLPTQ